MLKLLCSLAVNFVGRLVVAVLLQNVFAQLRALALGGKSLKCFLSGPE
jgi:hypothetical protein